MEAAVIVFITGAILCSLGYLLALFIVIFNIKYMKLRFVKMTSPRVNIVLLCGTFILYTGSLLLVLPMNSWAIETRTRITQARYWLMTVGFTAMFGSMLVKGWRVHRLFQYPRVHSVTIRDGSLFAGILVLLLLDVSLLVSWQVIDPIRCPLEQITYEDCSSDYYSVWMLVLLLYKYIIIFMCCYIGWQIAHITFPALDDSRCLLLSSGVTLTLSGTACLVFLLFPGNTVILHAAAAVFLWIGVTSTLFLVFIPKVMVVYKSGGLEPLMGSASKYVQQSVSSDVGIELVKILAENRYLKKQLEEREVLVNQLKKRVPCSASSDSGSHNVSANYSFTSSSSPALKPSLCCLLDCFSPCDNNQSLRVEQGTPLSTKDISFNNTANVLTIPTIQQNNIYHHHHHLSNRNITSRTLPVVTISSAVPFDSQPSIEHAEQHVVTEAVLQSAENISVTEAKPVAADTENLYINDVELLSSIADTYELGDDLDALSYISSCLNNSKSWSLPRRPERGSRLSGTLGNDQLYPPSAAGHTENSLKPRKQRRRQSVATTKVYVTDRGNPLIL